MAFSDQVEERCNYHYSPQKGTHSGSFRCGSVGMNLTGVHEDKTGLILGLAQWVKDLALL